jgi:Cu2+-exporting ATPase
MIANQRLDYSHYTRRAADGVETMDVVVDGIHCGGCIGRIERSLKAINGLTDARLNFTNRRLTLTWSSPSFDPAEAIQLLERMGYQANPFRLQLADEKEDTYTRFLFRCLAVSGFAAMNVMLLSVSVWSGNITDITPETRDLFHWLSAAIALPAAAYAGQPFFRSAWNALKARHTNMDVPISIGILLALGLSLYETAHSAEHAYFDSAVMLIFFLLCGRVLDQTMRRRTRAVAGNLAALKASTAFRLMDNGELLQLPSAALRVADRVLVRAGERIPADGVVVSGHAHLDESLITGETTPCKVRAGRQVYAGSINLDGALTIRVNAAGEDTFLDDIDRLLEKAVHARSRYVKLSDRIAGYYAPVVHAAAALTFIGWMLAGQSGHMAVVTAITVLIITCPCALALAIPAVQVVAASALFRSGVFLNAGDAIERLAEADIAVFDKTGTLTLPEPHVINAADIDADILTLAGRLALSSRHPLANAIARQQPGAQPFDDVIEEYGRGVRAMLDGMEVRLGSPSFCAVDVPPTLLDNHPGVSLMCFRHGHRHAVFVVHQVLRPDAAETIRGLSRLGIEVHILSGDRAPAVEPIAKALEVPQWRAGLTPAGKVAVIEAWKREGRKVLMVGDGLNDAPSLAAASVSISPITAADLSQAQADAVFLGKSLSPVLLAVAAARRARSIMRQNLYLALVYNTIAIPIAIAGFVTPLIAAVAMSGSSILVTLNALRARMPGQGVSAKPAEPPAASVTAAVRPI